MTGSGMAHRKCTIAHIERNPEPDCRNMHDRAKTSPPSPENR
jgi:hypothetical protein